MGQRIGKWLGRGLAASVATGAMLTTAMDARAALVAQLDDWRIYNHALTGTLDGNNLTGSDLFETWQANVPEPTSVAPLVLGSVALARRGRGVSGER